MSQFRYNLALSVLFDDEQSTGEVEGFPISIMESTEGKERMEAYACLRREIRQLMIRTSDLPRDVEDKFRRRLRYLRYKTNARVAGTPAFSLVTIGRQTGSPFSAPLGGAGRRHRKKCNNRYSLRA